MAITKLEHFTIRCSDLEVTRAFYRDVIGLTDGFRPAFGFQGHWLYAGDTPVVHLLDKAEAEQLGGAHPGGDTGALDHVAFVGDDAAAVRAHLESVGATFEVREFPRLMTQFFLTDPDGILVELNVRHG